MPAASFFKFQILDLHEFLLAENACICKTNIIFRPNSESMVFCFESPSVSLLTSTFLFLPLCSCTVQKKVRWIGKKRIHHVTFYKYTCSTFKKTSIYIDSIIILTK